MPFKNWLSPADLERRLLNWISKAHVPRYPFFDGLPSADATGALPSLDPTSASSQSLSSSSIGSSSSQDLNHWLEFVEDASRECDIEESQYPDTAVWFMRGELKEVMKERREVYLRESNHVAQGSGGKPGKIRDWEDFKKDLRRVVDEARRIFISTTSRTPAAPLTMSAAPRTSVPPSTFALLRRTHPYIASSLSLGLVIGGTVVLLPAISLGIEAWNRMKEGASKAGGQIACPS